MFLRLAKAFGLALLMAPLATSAHPNLRALAEEAAAPTKNMDMGKAIEADRERLRNTELCMRCYVECGEIDVSKFCRRCDETCPPETSTGRRRFFQWGDDRNPTGSPDDSPSF